MNWDAQMLSNEQHFIQSYYEKLSSEARKILQSNLEKFQGFEGDMMKPEDRWKFGMEKMGYDVTNMSMPVPEGEKEEK